MRGGWSWSWSELPWSIAESITLALRVVFPHVPLVMSGSFFITTPTTDKKPPGNAEGAQERGSLNLSRYPVQLAQDPLSGTGAEEGAEGLEEKDQQLADTWRGLESQGLLPEQMGEGLTEFCFQQSLERNKVVGGGGSQEEWS